MILYVIALLSSIVSGMGIGGGSIFIIIATILNLLEQRDAQAYNLVMFVALGIATTIFNLKNKNIDKKLIFKLIIPVCIGSIIGINIAKQISEENLRTYFYIFMLIIGIYEIISSLKNIIMAKTNNNERS